MGGTRRRRRQGPALRPGRPADAPQRRARPPRARRAPAGRVLPAVGPGPRHAPGGRAQLRSGAGAGPGRRVPRRGAAVRPGAAGGGRAAAGASARGGGPRLGGHALARGPKRGYKRRVQRLRGCRDVLAAAAAAPPRIPEGGGQPTSSRSFCYFAPRLGGTTPLVAPHWRIPFRGRDWRRAPPSLPYKCGASVGCEQFLPESGNALARPFRVRVLRLRRRHLAPPCRGFEARDGAT